MISNAFYYTFPAIRGIQASREYYVSMCPLRIIPKIFLFDEKELDAEFRAQRVLNKARIPEICSYIVNNPKDYVFSALTASIDGEVEFISISNNINEQNLGFLRIPMTAKFVINDGQHRRAAIEAALIERPELGDETIAVVFFVDLGLKRSQQMFADLNRYAVRPTKSLSLFYDYRDPYALMTKEIVEKVDVFNGLTEVEKSTISNRSNKLFTLSGIYNATLDLLQAVKNLDIKEQKKLAIQFWNEVASNIMEWQLVKNGEVSAAVLRRNYIHAHAVVLSAIGRAGGTLLEYHPNDWQQRLKKLRTIDWHRKNLQDWEGRALVGGRVSNSKNNVMLVTSFLKKNLGLPLSSEEQAVEETYLKTSRLT